MSQWQPIESAPPNLERCLLWCSDIVSHGIGHHKTVGPYGVVMGRITEGHVYGDGMSGNWRYTHFMPLPPPPEAE